MMPESIPNRGCAPQQGAAKISLFPDEHLENIVMK
jgi:hypothetical protein